MVARDRKPLTSQRSWFRRIQGKLTNRTFVSYEIRPLRGNQYDRFFAASGSPDDCESSEWKAGQATKDFLRFARMGQRRISWQDLSEGHEAKRLSEVLCTAI